MKIPALRAKIGTWTYYITVLTFEQVAKNVSKIDDQLHKSKGLKDLIQRSITENYLRIKEYILNQQEMFFNSLVLAVYDDYPDWREIEFQYEDFETYQMGLLDFPAKHKIFPVDGQHRVEGIKAAFKENTSLANERISVIFIGHKNDDSGKTKTRRLFTTLNRYAKPVSMDDIIALDEDDSIAIITRELLETFPLFTGKRVTKSKNKAIPDSDKTSITSIITLYQCNRELLKLFRTKRKKDAPDKVRDKKSLEEYLKFRPHEKEVELYNNFCVSFWNDFLSELPLVATYLKDQGEDPAEKYRNKKTGGNLIFRPVGILPLIQAAIEIHKKKTHTFKAIFSKVNKLDLNISKKPWRNILWNPNEKTMIMGNAGVVKLLLLYQYANVIRSGELSNLKAKYADRLNVKPETALNQIKVLKN
jgi:DNA sulfur modification protein DndB